MRKWKEEELAKKIAEKLPEVNRAIITSRQGRALRTRPRDPEEQKLLDELCIRNWNRLVAAGKIKKLGPRKWYMDFE